MPNQSDDKEIHEKQKDLVDLKFKYDVERHLMKMKELEYSRKTLIISHENEMMRQRIKTAEIRRTQQRQQHRR